MERRGEGEENIDRGAWNGEQWRGEKRGEVIMHTGKKLGGRVQNGSNGVERRRQWESKVRMGHVEKDEAEKRR